MAERDRTDCRRTAAGRRQSWYGAKKQVKRVLGWRMPNLAMRWAVGALRPELRRTGRLPAPAALKQVTAVVDDSSFVMLNPSECVVAKELYWGNGRRPQPADDIAVRLFSALARQSDVMLDVGAYTGLFTLAGTAVNRQLVAHAFEIVPEVYHALFDNCVRNRILDRVTLHHVGVGDPDAKAAMPVRSGDSALPCYYSVELPFDDGVPIRMVALDAFTGIVPNGSRVVLKVDVEGTEETVFGHGERFLAAHRPDVLCEVLHDRAEPKRLTALLGPYGYRFHLVRDHDLAPAGELLPSPGHRDWLFTTREADDLRELGIAVGEPR